MSQPSPTPQMGKKRKRECCDFDVCFYCEQPLSSRHEHDHFPVPNSMAGPTTVAACLNCHDLKDRISFTDWQLSACFAAVMGVPPGPSRILLAKLITELQRSGKGNVVGDEVGEGSV